MTAPVKSVNGKRITTPTVLVVLGATGDLASKKIFPAVYRLYQKKKLPKLLQIIGFSRRDLTDSDFREMVKAYLTASGINDKDKVSKFLEHIYYHRANFFKIEGYESLANRLGMVDDSWSTCSNKLFYLATPPKLYRVILNSLSTSGLTKPCSPNEGWTRIIVEKPFGSDLATAEELDRLLGKLFKEEQIFRIDHYLGKEMLRNILAFRFSNNIFEESWNNTHIESIHIKFNETNDLSGRGAFFDGVGNLRDIGQNHILQMLSLVTMDMPADYTSNSIWEKRVSLLRKLKHPSRKDIVQGSFRAQYKGFRNTKGVSPSSKSETYFKLKAHIGTKRWTGVTIVLEGGKALKSAEKKITITFKHPHPCLCPPGSDHMTQNQVTFSVDPIEEIRIRLWAKKPGYEMKLEEKEFTFPYRGEKEKRTKTEEYEKLLLDCFMGDQTLFVSTAGVEAMWRFVDPIIKSWQKGSVPLHTYEVGSDEILSKSNF